MKDFYGPGNVQEGEWVKMKDLSSSVISIIWNGNEYGSGHRGVAVLLPGFAIIW